MSLGLANRVGEYTNDCLFVVFLHGHAWLHCLKAYTLDKVIRQAKSFNNFFFGAVASGFIDRFIVHLDLLYRSVVPVRS